MMMSADHLQDYTEFLSSMMGWQRIVEIAMYVGSNYFTGIAAWIGSSLNIEVFEIVE